MKRQEGIVWHPSPRGPSPDSAVPATCQQEWDRFQHLSPELPFYPLLNQKLCGDPPHSHPHSHTQLWDFILCEAHDTLFHDPPGL